MIMSTDLLILEGPTCIIYNLEPDDSLCVQNQRGTAVGIILKLWFEHLLYFYMWEILY